jgi:hypothetical protein
MTIILQFYDNGASPGFSFPQGETALSQILNRKERQREQRPQTSDNNANGEKRPKWLAKALGLVLEFWVIRKENDRRDDRCRAKRSTVRD